MRTILEIRQEIETLLETELGNYIYANGLKTKAICILPDPTYGWDFPPPGSKVDGLEVVLSANTEIKNRPLLTGNYINFSSKILLKQWDSKKNTIIATMSLLKNLPECLIVRPRILPNTSLGNIESQTILINSAVIWE